MVTPELRIILVFLTSLISAVFLIPKLSRIATKIGLVDHPGLRKMHDRPLPLVGGLAMVISATFSFLLFIPLVGFRGYFVGVAILMLIGFLDDYREIGHREKFLAQILATSMLAYLSKIYLVSFGDLLGFGAIMLPDSKLIQWGVTVFCVVGVINAINLLDGLDGLAGGFSAIAFLTFAAHASLTGNSTVMMINLALLGAVIGFLRFNLAPAQVFMGDAGSLCLGFSLAFMSLVLTQGEGGSVKPVIALLILAVPIVDTITVMSKRILRGKSPFKPDRYHLHHIFVRFGMSKEWSVKVILGVCAIFCGISLLGTVYSIPEWILFLVFVLYFAGYVISSMYIIYIMRFSQKVIMHSKMPDGLNFWDSPGLVRLFEKVKIYRHMRRSSRHPVFLEIECLYNEKDISYKGSVVNISNGGVMTKIPLLQEFLGEVILRLQFEIDGKKHMLELPARHLWSAKNDESDLHGFQFLDFDDKKNDVIFRMMVKSKKAI